MGVMPLKKRRDIFRNKYKTSSAANIQKRESITNNSLLPTHEQSRLRQIYFMNDVGQQTRKVCQNYR